MPARRVLHVIHSTAAGGGATMLTETCTPLRDEFDFTVVSDGAGDAPARLRAAGVQYRNLGPGLGSAGGFVRCLPALSRLLLECRPDVVHLHGHFAASLGPIALGNRVPVVYTAHWPAYLAGGGPLARGRNHLAERVACARATVVVAVSRAVAGELRSRRLCAPGKLRVIHNSYPASLSAPSRTPAAEGMVIGFVGRLVAQKGLDLLLEALPAIALRHPAVHLEVVGDGPERNLQQALARRLGLAHRVSFTGSHPDPVALMPRWRLVAMPSRYEPFGNVAVEAMASGLPVVASTVGGLPEIVVDGATGTLVHPGDTTGLGRAIANLLADPVGAERMGTAGRERAVREFSPERMAAAYAALYRELAG